MIRIPCQWLDRIAIRHAAAHMPVPDGRDLHLQEAQDLLLRLDFSLHDVKPAAMHFGHVGQFRFDSPRPSGHASNDIVHGRLYKCGDNWRQKPLILLLHGWNDRLDHYYFFPRHARRLNELGINAATLQLPWQFDRRCPQLGAWSNFLCADILHTVKSAIQAMADIRAFVNWWLEKSSFIGLWGVSLGGWLTGLSVCHDSRIGAAALTVPVARLDRLIDEVEFCQTIRATLKNQHINLAALNPVSNHPLISREKILLVKAEYDLFIDNKSMEELWQAWEKPEVWRLQHGHISVLCARNLSRRVIAWLAAKAHGAGAK